MFTRSQNLTLRPLLEGHNMSVGPVETEMGQTGGRSFPCSVSPARFDGWRCRATFSRLHSCPDKGIRGLSIRTSPNTGNLSLLGWPTKKSSSAPPGEAGPNRSIRLVEVPFGSLHSALNSPSSIAALAKEDQSSIAAFGQGGPTDFDTSLTVSIMRKPLTPNSFYVHPLAEFDTSSVIRGS